MPCVSHREVCVVEDREGFVFFFGTTGATNGEQSVMEFMKRRENFLKYEQFQVNKRAQETRKQTIQ